MPTPFDDEEDTDPYLQALSAEDFARLVVRTRRLDAIDAVIDIAAEEIVAKD